MSESPEYGEDHTVDSHSFMSTSVNVTPTSNPEPHGVQKKRRRPALSCEQCRKRKVRCDRNEPCSTCIKSKIPASCTYVPTHTPPSWAKKNRAPKRSIEQAASKRGSNQFILPASERNEDDPSPEVNGGLGETPNSTATSPSRKCSSVVYTSDIPKTEKVDWLAARVHHLEEKLSTLGHETDDHVSTQGTESSAPVMGTVSKTRYFGRSHWMNGAAMLSEEAQLLLKVDSERGELSNLITKCKVLGRKIKENRFQHLSTAELGRNIPDRELADQFVEAYLRTFEGTLRILHIPSFRADYDRFWQNRDAADDFFTIQLQLVMALGSVFHDEGFTYRSMASQWVYEAQLWLMIPPEKRRMTITGIQIMCMIILARSVCSVGQDLVWVTTGGLIRKAMYMGLHRDPTQLASMTTYRAEMRRRLWATILELNLQSAFDAGGPPLLSPKDYDVQAPANLDDDQLGDELDGKGASRHPSDAVTQMSVPLELLKTLPLRLKLLSHANDFRAEDSYEDTLRYNSKLVQACRSLSKSMMVFIKNEHAQSSTPKVTEFHSSMAELLVYRCFHTLHQPVISRYLNDPRFFFSRKMYLDGALKILHICGLSGPRRAQGPVAPLSPESSSSEQSDFNRLMTNGAGMFRNIPIQSIPCIAIELLHSKASADHSFGMGLGYLPAVHDYDLRRTLDASNVWALRRIQSGETNPKAYCFMAASIAHVDAVAAGKSKQVVEEEMLQAAEEAARNSFEAMRQLAEREGILPEVGGGSGDEAVPMMEMMGETWLQDMPMDFTSEWGYDEMNGLLWGLPNVGPPNDQDYDTLIWQ